MLNIYLKVTVEKKRHTQNFDFLSLKVHIKDFGVFGELQLLQIFNF